MDYPPKLIDLEAEENVIHACLVDYNYVTELSTILVADDFNYASHRLIFVALCELANEGAGPDINLVARELGSDLPKIGVPSAIGMDYLRKLAYEMDFWTPSAPKYARIISRLGTLRRLMDAAANIVSLAYNSEDDANETWEQARRALETIEPMLGDDKEVLLWKDSIEALYEYQFAEQERQRRIEIGELTPIDFPWQGIRPYLEILDEGMLMVVAAATGVGKTTLFENLAEHWARGGLQVAFFHAELSKKKMLHRRTCRLTGVPMPVLKRGEGLDQVNKATDIVGNWRGGVNYIHCPSWTAQRVARKMRGLSRRGLCDVVIVDYLQKLKLRLTQGQNPAAGIGQQVEAIKTTAEILGFPVVMGSQFSRKTADREFKVASDIRGSGEVEEKANAVLTLHRPILDGPLIIRGVPVGKRGDRSPKMDCRMDKNTDGDTGNFTLIFKGSRYRILDINGAQEM